MTHQAIVVFVIVSTRIEDRWVFHLIGTLALVLALCNSSFHQIWCPFRVRLFIKIVPCNHNDQISEQATNVENETEIEGNEEIDMLYLN